ncbi:hypothetical protein V6N13_123141 [Hibiscus sabdariffa]|uniref:Uncharacterized protein n=2 Tax=Hibiscus sabdariffa TaxID=183260 RepID=A0ABR2CXP2_9ROSI
MNRQVGTEFRHPLSVHYYITLHDMFPLRFDPKEKKGYGESLLLILPWNAAINKADNTTPTPIAIDFDSLPIPEMKTLINLPTLSVSLNSQ